MLISLNRQQSFSSFFFFVFFVTLQANNSPHLLTSSTILLIAWEEFSSTAFFKSSCCRTADQKTMIRPRAWNTAVRKLTETDLQTRKIQTLADTQTQLAFCFFPERRRNVLVSSSYHIVHAGKARKSSKPAVTYTRGHVRSDLASGFPPDSVLFFLFSYFEA